MSSTLGAGDDPGKLPVDSKSGPTVTWPIKDKDTGIVIGTVVRQSDGVHQCVLPDGTVVENFTSHKFAMEFLHRRGQVIPSEELAARLKTDVDQLARMSPTEWRWWLSDLAKFHGLDEAKLREMVEAEIAANEKKALENRDELRQREDRAEKQRSKEKSEAKKEAERKKKAEERKREREEREKRKEVQRKARERQRALAAIVKLPIAEHEGKLATSA